MAIQEIGMTFNDSMVCAILSGRKTHTRRPLKAQPPEWAEVVSCPWRPGASFIWSEAEKNPPRPLRRWPVDKRGDVAAMQSPFGMPYLARIWVREAYRVQDFSFAPDLRCTVQYRADGAERVITGGRGALYINLKNPRAWRPSIHMPRAFCRTKLAVTSMGAERVQTISEDDAISEGVELLANVNDEPVFRNYFEDGYYAYSALESFKSLWDRIYGFSTLNAWAANPWVWDIGFSKCTAEV